MTATEDPATGAAAPGRAPASPPSPRPREVPRPDDGAPAAPPPGPPEQPASRRMLTVVGAVLAQTTVLTALLFYFGMQHAYYMFGYLGVNYTVLGLTAQDFLIRSADGLFVPVTVVAGIALCCLWLARLTWPRLPERVRRTLRRVAGPGAGTAGMLAIVAAGVAFVDPDLFAREPWLAGVCLAVGVPLAAWAFRPRRAKRGSGMAAVAEWTACFVLVAVGLFWAAGDYSAAVGTGRGANIEAGLAGQPDVVLFSESPLALARAGITEVACPGAGFRYDGLKLVMQAGDRYVLLPGGWRAGSGTALVLPRTDAVRLEFAAPGSAQGTTC